ncbi:MAG: hypothetical protein JRC87_01770 [Deltaproteobacteria bacterium]|nr:hypothetical protein [Deltaproteobacteria bacterium]
MILIITVLIFSQGFSAEKRSGVEKKEPASGKQQKGTLNWPAPFQPSEEVGADSEVSFPTDI